MRLPVLIVDSSPGGLIATLGAAGPVNTRRSRGWDDQSRQRGRLRHRLTIGTHALNVEPHGLDHETKTLLVVGVSRYATRQIRAPCPVAAGLVALDDVPAHEILQSSPACLRMLRSVRGCTVALGLPATVVRPGLVGCLYWR